MDYRQLGRSGLRVSALTLGTMTFGGARQLRRGRRRSTSTAPRRQIDLCPRRRRQPHRHRRRLLGRRCRRRSSARRSAAAATACCSRPRRACRWATGPTTPGSRATTSSRACEASLRRLRHRPHRPLPGARVGRPDAAGGDARRARRRSCARARCATSAARTTPAGSSMKALGDLRPPRPAALRQPADLLLAAGARGRVRAGAGRARPGRRASSSGARSPAACCRASTAATQHARRAAPAHRLGRAAGARPGAALRHRRRRWSRSARATASRPPRSRSPGTLGKPGVTSLVIGARTEEQLVDNLARGRPRARPPTSARGSTRSARRRCSTPTGTRPRRRGPPRRRPT